MFKILLTALLILPFSIQNACAQTDDFGLEETNETVAPVQTETASENESESVTETEEVKEEAEAEAKEEAEAEPNTETNIAVVDEDIQENENEPAAVELKKEAAPQESENLSYYIQHLNLSVEQQDQVKYLSDDYQLKKEQLLRSLDVIRQQAHVLEAQNLAQFESILTPEQKSLFHELKRKYESRQQ